MVVWPSTVTWAMSRVPPPIVTSGPTTQNGPTSTSCARRALGSTLAKGEIFGMLLPQLTTDNGQLTTDNGQRDNRERSYKGSESTNMNLISASQASLSPTNALQRT